MTATDAKIELRNVTKRYGDLVAVDDLSLTIREGELMSFLGPSGSGKTTTLNLVAGLESPTEGDVFIDGERVNDVSARDRDVGMVFQDLALFEQLSVRKNVGFARMVDGGTTTEVDRTAERVAETTNLPPEILDRRVSKLNPSDRQRVALGRVIAAEPSVVLLDEPMSNLDAEEAIDMRAEVKDLKERIGQTMIYVTHDQEEAMSLADRIMVIHEGTLQQVGTPRELYERPANRFVAGFIGSPTMNFLTATVSADGLVFADARLGIDAVKSAFDSFDPAAIGDRVTVGIRPEALVYDGGDERVSFTANFTGSEPLGAETVLYATTGDEALTVVTERRPRLDRDEQFRLGTSLDEVYLIDPAPGEVLY